MSKQVWEYQHLVLHFLLPVIRPNLFLRPANQGSLVAHPSKGGSPPFTPRPNLLELLQPSFSARAAGECGGTWNLPPRSQTLTWPLGRIAVPCRTRERSRLLGVMGLWQRWGTHAFNLHCDGKRHLPDTKSTALQNFAFPLQHPGAQVGQPEVEHPTAVSRTPFSPSAQELSWGPPQEMARHSLPAAQTKQKQQFAFAIGCTAQDSTVLRSSSSHFCRVIE